MTGGELGVLSVLVFFAGVLDSLAGGGGLLTLPAYLSLGVPPGLVLGTNKLASTIGTVASTVRYSRSLGFAFKPFLPVIAAALAGAVAGAGLALRLDPRYLRPLLLAALPLICFAVLWDPHFGKTGRADRHSPRGLRAREAALAFVVGGYDGFFGPGTGTFFALGFTALCGHTLLESTTRAKVLNQASNISATVVFLAAGKLDVRLGLAMGAVSFLGNTLGSHLGVRKGAAVIRPAVLLAVAGLFAKLALDAWSGR